MKPHILFLANPVSPHVPFWSECLGTGVRLSILHVETAVAASPDPACMNPLPVWVSKLGSLKYVALGAWLRLNPKKTYGMLLHAHNSSGYGLTAALSGRPYVVTTYGSEVYAIEENGPIYNWMIHWILAQSRLVTCSSLAMQNFLQNQLDVPEQKILRLPQPENAQPYLEQHDVEIHKPIVEYTPANPLVFLINRRSEPLYRTLEIALAFDRVFGIQPNVRLIILEGAACTSYYHTIKAQFPDRENMVFVDGFLSKSQLYELILSAHISISAPKTDQLSSSILDAMMLGSIPALSTEPGYLELEEADIFWISNGDFDSFFEAVGRLQVPDLQHLKSQCLEFYHSHFQYDLIAARALATISDCFRHNITPNS